MNVMCSLVAEKMNTLSVAIKLVQQFLVQVTMNAAVILPVERIRYVKAIVVSLYLKQGRINVKLFLTVLMIKVQQALFHLAKHPPLVPQMVRMVRKVLTVPMDRMLLERPLLLPHHNFRLT
jgi:hypothetical protein